MAYTDLSYLTVSLPEDIEKLKWYGDFERARKVIHMRLEKDLPVALRKRLELEQEILKRLPLKYIYTKEEALRQMQETFKGATEEELEQLRDEGAAEWIFVRGQVRYKDDFMENLLKTRQELWPRLLDPSRVEGRVRGSRLLDETISAMKKNGGMAYRMRVRASLRIQESAGREGARIRVHLPIPIEGERVKNFKLLGTSAEPVCVSPGDYPQRTVCMEGAYKPGEEFWVEYEMENHAGYVDIDEDKAFECEPAGELAPCLEEQFPHIRFTPYLRDLTREAVGEEKNPLKRARRIYDYITTHVTYSFVRQYSTIANLSEYMAAGLKGDCGIYAILFITMCRIARIPAKWQSGLYATPLEIGCHDWARFYVEPYGWLYADCSFGGGAYRAGAVERWNFYFGNLDPFRIPCCSQFQHEFMPPKSFMREDPYDNQVGEAEFEDRGLMACEYKTRQQVVEMEAVI